MNGPETAEPDYLERVLDEIEVEVTSLGPRLDTSAGARLEELFQRIAPVAARRQDPIASALADVDARARINPEAPVASSRAGGTVLKRAVRSAGRWYLGFVTQQVSELATTISRTLHLLADQLDALRTETDELRPPTDAAVDMPALHRPDAWWVDHVVGEIGTGAGRVLHTACGNGWLVERLRDRGVDAYGVDPRPAVLARTGLHGLDLRCETAIGHLRSLSSTSLRAVVLTGIVEPMAAPERHTLLRLLSDRIRPGGHLVLHSARASAWFADDAPPAADLAPGRPLRPSTWELVLGQVGFGAELLTPSGPGPDVTQGPGDFVMLARRSGVARAPVP